MLLLAEKHDALNSYRAAGWFGSSTLTDSHSGGMNAAFCDGHVQRIARTDELLQTEGSYTRYQKRYIRNN